MESDKILSSAVVSASYNMVLQLLFRLLTFVLNAFVLRFITKDLLGVVNVRLTLLYLTTQLISREAFRRSCLSIKASDEKHWNQTINLLWTVPVIGIICASFFGYVWAFLLEQPDPEQVPHYYLGVVAFATSTVIEMLSEPLYVIGQVFLFVKLKVFIEGVAITVRCVVTVVLVLIFPNWGILSFSIAQILYTTTISGIYYVYFITYTKSNKSKDFPFHSPQDFLPSKVPGLPMISYGQASLTWSFFKQSFLKQILTDGEKYVMTIFDILSFGDQGIFDVVTNLGSLAARFIFHPIEESGYLFFSQTLQRTKTATEQSKESIELATKVLESLLKFVVLLGLTILVFGYSYSYLLLDIYGGELLSSGTGPMLLRWFCVYVLLIAINGTTECFAFATMSQAAVDRYNHKMLLFSLLFLCASWYLTKLYGSVGFILANCLNMSARISHSIYHIKSYYSKTTENPLVGLKPSFVVALSYFLIFIATHFSEISFCCKFGWSWKIVHVSIGTICLFLLIGIIYVHEKNFVHFINKKWKSRGHVKKQN